MNFPKVTIVIINWNGFTDTKDCLTSLSKISYKNYKVALVDNGSRNGEGQILKKLFPNVKLITNSKNTGFCEANNLGMLWAIKNGSQYVLLLNNDTIVAKDFLEKLLASFRKHPDAGIVNPKILYFKSSTIWAMGGKLATFPGIPRMIGQGSKTTSWTKDIVCDFASGCAMIMPINLVREVGLLDTRYFAYWEDTDYSFRVKRAGYKIWVNPQSIIWHKVSKSTLQKSLWRIGAIQSYLLARNGLVFGKLNYSGLRKVIFLFSQIAIKFPLYLIFKVQDFDASIKYTKGVWEGVVFLITNKLKKPYYV